jgi:hypothetical protein
MNAFFKGGFFFSMIVSMGAATAAGSGCTIAVPSLNGVDAGSGGKGGSGATGGDTSPTDPGSGGGGGGATQPDGGSSSGSGGSGGGSGSGGGTGGGSGGGSGGTGTGTCPGNVLQSSLPAWKSPKTGTAGSCNTNDMSAISAAAAKSGAAYQDLYNAITSPTCRSCVFSNEADAQWQVIVWAPDMASNQALANYGACYSTASSVGPSCGSADFQTETCLQTACPPTCADVSTCQKTAASGTCAPEVSELQSACSTQLSTLESQCDTLTDAINIVCGPGAG